MSCNPRPTIIKDTYIFPENFRGIAVIAFNISKGKPVEMENDRRVFVFDSSGILLTQAKDPKGIIDQKFYFQDKKGGLIEVKKFDYITNRNTYFDSSAVTVFGWHEKGVTGEQTCSFKFFDFKVCSAREIDTIDKGFKTMQKHVKIKSIVCPK